LTDNQNFYLREQNEKDEINKIDRSVLISFFKEIETDYEIYGPQLHTAFDKFAERYLASKSISIPRLCSFLYDGY